MNDTAIIISAIAGLVTAIGVVVAAASRFAPVLTAINKMLADQHKRAKEARKSAEANKPSAANASAAENDDRLSKEGLSSLVWWHALSLLIDFIALVLIVVLVLVSPEPTVSRVAIAGGLICVISFVTTVVSFFGSVILKLLIAVGSSLMNGQIVIVDGQVKMLESQLTTIEAVVRRSTQS